MPKKELGESAAAGEAVKDLARKIVEAIWEKQSGFPTPKTEELIQSALEPLLASGREMMKEYNSWGHMVRRAHKEHAAQLARFERRAGEDKR